MLVWSHDPERLSCVPLSAEGRPKFGDVLRTVMRGQAVRVGEASEEMLAAAKRCVDHLLGRRKWASERAATQFKVAAELVMRRVGPCGRRFWNMDGEPSPGCLWVQRQPSR